jgi:predicted dehydrogenase
MNYGVIGTGYWGKNHVRVAAELQEEGVIDTVVLCDVDEERVAELADLYGLEYATDHTALYDRVDAVTLATPSPTHRDLATDLLDNGIDVLVEKPLALSSEEAWQIVETAEANGCTLAVGHIFRYHPALRELKERVDRGDLGKIKYLNASRFAFRVPRETAGVLYSLAVHDVDIYRYLLDERPGSIYCRLDRWIREDVDETATLVLEFGDTTGVINESWQVPIFGKRRDLIVVGSEQVAYVDFLADTEVEIFDYRVERTGEMLRASEEGSTIHEAPDEEPLRLEVLDFIDACRHGDEPVATGRIGAETVEMLERAERSAATDSVVSL